MTKPNSVVNLIGWSSDLAEESYFLLENYCSNGFLGNNYYTVEENWSQGVPRLL